MSLTIELQFPPLQWQLHGEIKQTVKTTCTSGNTGTDLTSGSEVMGGEGGVNEGLWRREKSPVKILFDPLFGDILGQVSHPQMACLSHHSTSKPSVLAPRRPPSPPHVTLLHIAAPKALPALSHQQPCRHWRQGTEPSPPAAPPVPASLLCCWGPAVATHADFSLKKSFFQTSFVSDHKLLFHWRYSNPSLVHILKFHTGNGK